MSASRFSTFVMAGLLTGGGLLTASPSVYADNINPPPYVDQECSTHGDFSPSGPLTVIDFDCDAGDLAFSPGVIVTNVPGNFVFNWPNFVDELPLKRMRLQLTFEGPPDHVTESFQVSVVAEDNGQSAQVVDLHTGPAFPESCPTCIGDLNDQYWYWFDDWVIRPNPDHEVITVGYPTDWVIAQVVIDTISTPEPGTLAILSLGLAAFGLLRRRPVA